MAISDLSRMQSVAKQTYGQDPQNILKAVSEKFHQEEASRSTQTLKQLFQCVVFYNEHHKKGLIKWEVPLSFVSQEIFTDEKDAEKFFPYFISRLIKTEKIPQSVVENNIVNEELVKCAIAPLHITVLEKDDGKC